MTRTQEGLKQHARNPERIEPYRMNRTQEGLKLLHVKLVATADLLYDSNPGGFETTKPSRSRNTAMPYDSNPGGFETKKNGKRLSGMREYDSNPGEFEN